MFSNAGYREFEVRTIGMIRTLSALIDSLTVPLGEKSKADIRNMCNEMKEYGVATSELELYLLKDDELEAFVADIRTSLGGENENAIIDALRAASVLRILCSKEIIEGIAESVSLSQDYWTCVCNLDTS